ncbi:GGDEF domain-containing protein [Arenimonas composti]|nr:GGDEF domain-containing protein [Arenimonas composti]
MPYPDHPAHAMADPQLPLDPRTIFLLATLMILLNGAVLGLMHRSLVADVQPAASAWRIGTLLVAMGCLLQALQTWLPPMLALGLSNGLLLAGLTGYVLSLRLFDGRGWHRWLLLPTLFGTLGVLWFIEVQPDLPARIVTMSAAMCVILLACVRELRRERPAEAMTSRRVLTLIFALVALLTAARLGITVYAPPAGSNLLQRMGLVHMLALLVTTALPVIGTTAFVLMCLERIRGQWQQAASTDYLTSLANRRTVAEAGERALHAARRQQTPLAVAIIDVDHFKVVNDTWGHAIGDHVLRHLARLLVDTARRSDLPGRYGGEEFVLLLEGSDAGQAVAAGERFRTALAASPCEIADAPRPLTVSIGVAVLDPADRSFDDLLRRADAALYAAKSAGRDRLHLAP